jgi:hypothetical protein
MTEPATRVSPLRVLVVLIGLVAVGILAGAEHLSHRSLASRFFAAWLSVEPSYGRALEHCLVAWSASGSQMCSEATWCCWDR